MLKLSQHTLFWLTFDDEEPESAEGQSSPGPTCCVPTLETIHVPLDNAVVPIEYQDSLNPSLILTCSH
jgi:hypothetical protein